MKKLRITICALFALVLLFNIEVITSERGITLAVQEASAMQPIGPPDTVCYTMLEYGGFNLIMSCDTCEPAYNVKYFFFQAFCEKKQNE
mgnify:CR=1 FL=1|tara:strand:- start:20138 stop:20404 length:267 start_codon:yes stop_codon:yes gene_type:complete